jgi:hypothetical protein
MIFFSLIKCDRQIRKTQPEGWAFYWYMVETKSALLIDNRGGFFNLFDNFIGIVRMRYGADSLKAG